MCKFSIFKKEYTFCFLLLPVIAIIWVWGFSTVHFNRPDAYDYAQMGREISNGNGFSTLQIFPRHIPFLHKKGYLKKDNWPNLYRYPLPAILNAFLYKITKDIIKAAVLQSGIAFLLSIPVLFILATKLTSLNVAIISTIFYAANPLVFVGSYNGMAESLATFFILSLFLIGLSGKLLRWKCLVMGIICGLGYLTRSQFILLFPLVALYIWISSQKKARLPGSVLLLIGFLIAAGPWFIRNIAVAGDPTFSFSNSRNLTADTSHAHRSLETQLEAPLETSEILKQYGLSITKKFLRNMLNIVNIRYWAKTFPPDSIFLLFLLLSFIYRKHSSDKRYNIFRDGTIALVFCTFLTVSLAYHRTRFYTPLQPLIYIVGIHEIFLFLGNIRFSYLRKLKHVAFYGLILFGIFRLYNITMAHKNWPIPLSASESESYEFIKQIADRNTIIAADTSYIITLEVGCRSLRLPAFPVDLLKINDNYFPIDYILIPPWRLNPNRNYAEFVRSNEFKREFKFVKALPNDSLLFKRSQQMNF